jgi:hypothetical protein
MRILMIDDEPTLAGFIGHGLHELADSEGADRLVLGSSRHGMLGPVLVGITSAPL